MIDTFAIPQNPNSVMVCTRTVPVPSWVKKEGDTNHLCYGTVSLNITSLNYSTYAIRILHIATLQENLFYMDGMDLEKWKSWRCFTSLGFTTTTYCRVRTSQPRMHESLAVAIWTQLWCGFHFPDVNFGCDFPSNDELDVIWGRWTELNDSTIAHTSSVFQLESINVDVYLHLDLEFWT